MEDGPPCFPQDFSCQPHKPKFIVWPTSRSLAATWKITLVFFSFGYLDVSVPRVSLIIGYIFTYVYLHVTIGGFPHSDIAGSILACSSPTLFAAYHVLLRLLVPRHPPYALCYLTFFYSRLDFAFLRCSVSSPRSRTFSTHRSTTQLGALNCSSIRL